jgi:hypothetical protein
MLNIIYVLCIYVFMFARAISGPKKSRFSVPTPSNAHRNDVAPLKIIAYHAIRTTGTLIYSYSRETVSSKAVCAANLT